MSKASDRDNSMEKKSGINNKPITSESYWNSIHVNKDGGGVFFNDKKFEGVKFFSNVLLFEKIKTFFRGGKILEVGAGSSDWLIKMARDLPHAGCTGLDYSRPGCESLAQKAKKYNLDDQINVVCEDMFSPPDHLVASQDFVFTYGVVEHFSDTAGALSALKAYLNKSGVLFTIIPNMSGLCGYLTKIWAPEIYKIHVPLDLENFKKAHLDAKLEILYADYICSSNFGVISSCFPKRNFMSPRYLMYLILVRINVIIWWFERYIFRLPATKIFSPYILVVSGLNRLDNEI